jgi:Cys-rich repeat protein
MKGIYISLALIIGLSLGIFVFYPRKMANHEGFFFSMCQKDSDCPKRFKCDSGKCADTRPKGN